MLKDCPGSFTSISLWKHQKWFFVAFEKQCNDSKLLILSANLNIQITQNLLHEKESISRKTCLQIEKKKQKQEKLPDEIEDHEDWGAFGGLEDPRDCSTAKFISGA